MIDTVRITNEAQKRTKTLSRNAHSEYILESVYWTSIAASHGTIKYLSQIGETKLSTTLGTRTVTIIGWVTNTTIGKVENYKEKLASFVVPNEELSIYYGDKRIRATPNSTIKFPEDKIENNEEMCKFTITATAFNPLFEDEFKSIDRVSSTSGKFRFPWILGPQNKEGGTIMGIREPSLISIINSRSQMELGMVIRFIANGTVVNPALYKISETIEKIEIATTMEPGDVITINSNTGEKSITLLRSGIETNIMRLKTFESSWLKLTPGTNVFRYAAEVSEDNLDTEIVYTNMYYEVEK